mmetsp:Transcript_71265/g.200582  ORF Transcript_71265/g.200582 Transcript_71265/m.200582 type:complete len:566 (-) Transcript_71265:371-2068(-)
MQNFGATTCGRAPSPLTPVRTACWSLGGSESVLLPQLQRFGAHLIIFLREVLGHSEDDVNGDDVVSAYVDHLVAHQQVGLVALYTSHINDPATKRRKYVHFMKEVQDPEDRQTCIDLALKHFGDEDQVFQITTTTVDTIRKENSPSARGAGAGAASGMFARTETVEGDVQATNDAIGGGVAGSNKALEVSSTDKRKIQSIPWLCIEPTHKAEAVRQSNVLLCQFFGVGVEEDAEPGGPWKLDAAKLLVERFLDASAMETVHEYARMSDKDGNPFPSLNRHPSEWARVLKEHRCWQAFLGANDAYEEWHAMLVQKEQEQVEFERYEKQYGQHGGGGQQRGFVPLEAAYPLSAREVAAATDTETLYAHAVGAKEFGEKTWERVQMQCNEVHTKQEAAEAALMMVLDFQKSRWNLKEGEAKTMESALVGSKGWMVVGADDDDIGDQYTLIRQRCLPVVIVWLHKVLLDTGRWYKKAAQRMKAVASEANGLWGRVEQIEIAAANIFRKALQVADLVASREYRLYTVLQSEGSNDHHPQVLLKQLNESATELLELTGTLSLDMENPNGPN